MSDYVFDIEVYPNVFTATFYDVDKDKYLQFEISSRNNQRGDLLRFLRSLKAEDARMIGFNSWFYDYPVIHHFITNIKPTMGWREITSSLYAKNETIINTGFDNRWVNTVRPSEVLIKQIDLYRVHHFDNKAKSTSLKLLEFNMGMESIQELPFDPGTNLTEEQIDTLLDYNKHDVKATAFFYQKSLPMLEFREKLSEKYGRDFLNHNDIKIGKDLFVIRLQNEGVMCYHPDTRQPIQTKRNKIVLEEIIFDYIHFDRPEFNAVLNWLRKKEIRTTKAVFTEIPVDHISTELKQFCNMNGPKGTVKNLNCIIDGFQFDFGTGGIHGSVESSIVESDDDNIIIDIDVTSLYPSIAIANRLHPKHLGNKFCAIYADIKKERLKHKKGSVENAALKLSLNGVYGASNDQYSPFYDPQFTMSITVNGQLLLCMLAEKIMKIQGLKLIQINTDGITMRLPRFSVTQLKDVMFNWEMLTGLDLEMVEYERMAIRDVNSYLAKDTSGKIKRKGAYEYHLEWHKNFSSLVVPKVAEAVLLNDVDVEDAVRNHQTDMDFMLRTKVPRNSRLELVDERELDVEVIQRVSRYYYVKRNGKYLVKVMPPTKGNTKERRIGVNSGRDKLVRSDRVWQSSPVKVCNDSITLDRDIIDFDWYISEVNKLVQPLCK